MKVRRFKRDDGRNLPFGCSWYVDGKRKAKFFETAAERDEEAEKLRDAAREHGASYLRIDPKRHLLWLQAEEILKGADPVAAARLYARHHYAATDKDFDGARLAFLAERAGRGIVENRIAHLRHQLEIFGAALKDAGRAWQAVDAAFIRDWAYALPFTNETKVEYLKAVRAFYGFVVGERWLEHNPAAAVKRPKIVRGEVKFLTADETQRMLATAWERDRELCGYLALGAFAGMRSSGIQRVDPKHDLKFDQRGILMPAEKTKSARRHFVQGFPPNLWAWLKAAPVAVIGRRQWDDRRAAVAAWANVTLPKNALRHSFCSHHVALYGNADRTATLLTHRNTGELWEHYRGNATKADARRYFEILPP